MSFISPKKLKNSQLLKKHKLTVSKPREPVINDMKKKKVAKKVVKKAPIQESSEEDSEESSPENSEEDSDEEFEEDSPVKRKVRGKVTTGKENKPNNTRKRQKT